MADSDFPLGLNIHQMVTTVSRMLLEEREKEEAALNAIVDKRASAPSWWPASRGAMGGESHYERIRRAEKILAREESQVVEGRGLALKNQDLKRQGSPAV